MSTLETGMEFTEETARLPKKVCLRFKSGGGGEEEGHHTPWQGSLSWPTQIGRESMDRVGQEGTNEPA